MSEYDKYKFKICQCARWNVPHEETDLCREFVDALQKALERVSESPYKENNGDST